LREPEQRLGRDCLHPEISRTYTIGKEGSSGGQFYEQYLKEIVLNQEAADFSQLNRESLLEVRLGFVSILMGLKHLVLQNNFAELFAKMINSATEIHDFSDLDKYENKTLMMYYDGSERDFSRFADKFGVMKDFKAGIPRMGYKGAVKVWKGSNQVIIAPRDIKQKI